MSIAARRDVFQAIADPTRRQIIRMIATKAMNLNSIADNFEMSRPAISQHIKILTECGLITINRQGRERYCEIQVQPLKEVSTWIEQYRELWEGRLDAIGSLLDELQPIKSARKQKSHFDKLNVTKSKINTTACPELDSGK